MKTIVFLIFIQLHTSCEINYYLVIGKENTIISRVHAHTPAPIPLDYMVRNDTTLKTKHKNTYICQ